MPLAATLKEALAPAATETLAGCVVIAGATGAGVNTKEATARLASGLR